jgi:integrase
MELLNESLARHWRPNRKPSTVTSFEQIIKGRLIPQFGALRISDLRRSDIRRWHSDLCQIPVRANRALAVLRKALSIAVADELIATNPAMGVAPHPERPRDRYPNNSEIRAIWAACDTGTVSAAAALLFKLLVLTGCRVGELRTTRVEWIDLEMQVLRLPDSKVGARNIPLSTHTVSLLCERRGEWVFPNRDGTGPISPSSVSRCLGYASASSRVREPPHP